jgi:hypothetical protein
MLLCREDSRVSLDALALPLSFPKKAGNSILKLESINASSALAYPELAAFVWKVNTSLFEPKSSDARFKKIE